MPLRCLGNFSSQFLVYDLLEVCEWLCAYDGKSIHKKGRGGLHAKVKRKLHIFLNEGIVTSIRKTGGECIHIQVKIGGVLDIRCFIQCFAAE